MGYESKMYVVIEYKNGRPMKNWDTGEIYKKKDGTPKCWAEVVATVDCCKCGSMAYDVFKEEADGLFYDNHGSEEPTTEDCYGSPLMSADLDDVIAWIDKNNDGWWRLLVASDLLKSFSGHGDCFKVYHYGY